MYQYHLDYPNGDLQDCVYDSGGKKQCVHHHPHGNLAVNPPLADQSQEKIYKCYSEQSHSAVGSVQGDGTHTAERHSEVGSVQGYGTHPAKR